MNRIIDDAADAAERALLPALVGGVEAFLAGRVSRPAYRPVVPPQNRTPDPGMGEGSSR